ncbi:MAG: cytochrome c [Bacteroidia bacterium]|nr:cytochrome c [Bacteroidia bacterium]
MAKQISTAALMAFLAIGCSSRPQESVRDDSPKYTQYYLQGEKLFQTHCSNCHQADGTGLGRLYPPLNKSDYMDDQFADVVCLIRNGKSGEIKVNGAIYNQPMPGVATLTDLEVAEIATYIYNTWTHKRGLIEVTAVSPILSECPEAAPYK